eukprot:s443_g22.t1
MEHLQKVVDLYGDADIVLTTAEWEKVFTLGKGFLDIYSMLNAWAAEEERLLFHKVCLMRCVLLAWNTIVLENMKNKALGCQTILARFYVRGDAAAQFPA